LTSLAYVYLISQHRDLSSAQHGGKDPDIARLTDKQLDHNHPPVSVVLYF